MGCADPWPWTKSCRPEQLFSPSGGQRTDGAATLVPIGPILVGPVAALPCAQGGTEQTAGFGTSPASPVSVRIRCLPGKTGQLAHSEKLLSFPGTS